MTTAHFQQQAPTPPQHGVVAESEVRQGTAAPYSVFLVEDSPAIRETLVQAMESSGLVQVTGFAETADDAWDKLRSSIPDAVVIDLHLRSGTGFDLLAKLKETSRLHEVVKIVLTNYAAPTFRQRCLALGANFFFDKSLEFDRVIDVLGSLAEQKKSSH